MQPDADSGAVLQDSKPYKDGELLREMYVEKQMSTIDIAEELDCAPNTVRKYLMRNGVEIRDLSEAVALGHGHHPNEVPFQTKRDKGTEVWYYNNDQDDKGMVYHHRLLAVAIWGFDEVADKVVHHKNELRWDNRPENLELMTHGEHSSHHHRKLSEEEYYEIIERYENEDVSTYDLAEEYPITSTAIGDIIRRGGPSVR